jgi:hypothetical protein
MKCFILTLCLLATLLFVPAESRAQCQPGFTGPFVYVAQVSYFYPLTPKPIPHGPCTFIIHYCTKTWTELGNTRYSYDYWVEATGCPFSAMSQGEAAAAYSAINDQLLRDNPAEFEYANCGSAYQTTVDFSHATCVYEEVHDHGDDKPTYEYHACPGSGLCYERSLVCWKCLYGQTPAGNCNPAPPGLPDRELVTSQQQSWTTGENDCGTYDAPWGEVTCMPVCNSDGPGPDLGMAHSGDSPTLAVESVRTTPQQTSGMEHQHATSKH